MLNYETLLSSYDDKLTLLQWLKKVEAALKDASAVSFKVNKKGDATLTFSIVFEDGSELESGEIVLQQGESVESAAIVNGHLILTLTNGDELDAGQLLNGDLNVSGNLAVSGNIASNGKITGAEIVENMEGYGISMLAPTGYTLTPVYVGAVKNGNKLTIAVALNITKSSSASSQIHLCDFTMPTEVMDKIYPSSITNDFLNKPVYAFASATNNSLTFAYASKAGGKLRISGYFPSLTADTPYYWRLEATFLLSENLAA